MMKPFPLFHKDNQKKGKTDYILNVDHLVKTYDGFTAVDGISFSVKRGSLFAFLGLNGAGKSTTINIITQILSKDSGTITIDGMDLDREGRAIKNEIGIVFQNSVLDPLLTPRENLTIRAGFYGIHGAPWKERFSLLTEMLDLSSFLDRPVGKLSGGQRRRVDIARAMVHNPKLLILDEPTTGLDPQTRLGVWNLVNELRAQTGMTVFLTTHYMEEAEKATFVVIMDKGKIIASGTPTELKNEYSGDYVFIYQKRNEEIDVLLTTEKRNYTYSRDGHYYKVTVIPGDDVLNFIADHRQILSDFEIQKGNMDDVFLNVTGVRELMEAQEDEKQ